MKVLVVDDDIVCREVLRMMLKKLCSEVVIDTVENGLDAVSAVVNARQESKPYQFILIDFHMPLLDASEIYNLIRLHEDKNGYNRCPICIVSSDESCRNRFGDSPEKDPCTFFLFKPVRLDTLENIYSYVNSYMTQHVL